MFVVSTRSGLRFFRGNREWMVGDEERSREVIDRAIELDGNFWALLDYVR